jgi:hypothetical protein
MEKLHFIILIMAITPLILIFYIYRLHTEIKELKDSLKIANGKVKKHEKSKNDLMKFYIGSRALFAKYPLVHISSNTNFTVDYEVEVIDLSETQVKVNAIDYQSDDKFANDPSNKQAILSFLKNKWVDKKDLQIIIDESHKRHLKLEELGI